ncbi:MAG: hypothetical protein MN733_08335 [Nitrososphaera sp.]|nr:hypothetical protein [Nitrososphaera sp.]
MSSAVYSVPFEQLSEQLEAAIGWMKNLGIPTGRTRLGHYQRSFDQLLDVHRRKDEAVANSRFPDFVNTLFEAHDLIAIHQGLGNGQYDEYIKDHLKTLSSGPNRCTDEHIGTSSNRSRNFAFELLVVSKLVLSGIELDFSIKTDIACKYENWTLLFECKRLQSEKKVEANVRDAFKQLQDHYRSPSRASMRGTIALDISRIVNPEFKLLTDVGDSAIGDRLKSISTGFLDAYATLWQSRNEQKTIAVLARVSLMAINQDRDNMLTYCQQYALSPIESAGAINVSVAKQLAYRLMQSPYGV